MPQRLGRYEIKTHLSTGGMAEVYLAVHHAPGDFEKPRASGAETGAERERSDQKPRTSGAETGARRERSDQKPRASGAETGAKRERSDQQLVAVKVLLPELAEDPRLLELFLYEARLAARLSHPNICQVFDAGEDGGRHFMVLEYLAGQTLGRVVRRGLRVARPLPARLAAFVVARAAEALAYAHERVGDDGVALNIVHRDVSPGNVMVTYDGQVKLLDFGIARAADRKFRTRTGEVRGKLAYMSPEQIAEADADARSDIFALGAVLHECVTGTSPFEAETDLATIEAVLRRPVPALPPEADPRVAEVVARCLERDRTKRPQSARELVGPLDALGGTAAELRAYVLELFETERAEELARAEKKKTVALVERRSKAPLLAGAGAAVALAGAAAFVGLKPAPFTPPPISIVVPAPAAPPEVAPVAAPVVPAAPSKPKRPVARGEGTLSLDTTPWTDVYFQGRKLGTTPIFEVELPAGRQKLRAVNKQAKIDRMVEVVIVDGELTTRKVKW
ncbi:MAG: serine/threonine protein kinase [Myxococcaceae bacterium]|nr:serine/threonine protein kinase [Myxococcaceae bacterium]